MSDLCGVGAAQKEVLAEGFLQKHSPNKALVSRWQTRHFVLTPATLAYYKKQSGTTFPPPNQCGVAFSRRMACARAVMTATDATPKGVIELRQVCNVMLKTASRALRESPGQETSVGSSSSPGKKAVFEVVTLSGRTYVLAADTIDGARRWVEALLFTIGEINNRAPIVSAPTFRTTAATKPPGDGMLGMTHNECACRGCRACHRTHAFFQEQRGRSKRARAAMQQRGALPTGRCCRASDC